MIRPVHQCHSDRREESRAAAKGRRRVADGDFRFFTPLRCVQNDRVGGAFASMASGADKQMPTPVSGSGERGYTLTVSLYYAVIWPLLECMCGVITSRERGAVDLLAGMFTDSRKTLGVRKSFSKNPPFAPFAPCAKLGRIRSSFGRQGAFGKSFLPCFCPLRPLCPVRVR